MTFTREQALAMAEQAGIDYERQSRIYPMYCDPVTLLRFAELCAELCAAAEREACAQVCEKYTKRKIDDDWYRGYVIACADNAKEIRERAAPGES